MDEKKVSPSPSPPMQHEEVSPAHGHPPRVYRTTNVDGEVAYQEHGALIDHKVPQEDVVQSHPDLAWSRFRHFMRDYLSEFFGTFILILFGDGVVAQVVLSGGEKGQYQSISWGWGIGVMLGVYASGVSGGHINPAVTFANCIFRKFPWRKFPGYMLAQTLGAMCASAVVYGNYKSAIDVFEGGPDIRTVPGYSETASAGIFCTYPAPFMTRTGMFFSEIVSSTILMFMIYALKDDGNIGAGPLIPLCLFFLMLLPNSLSPEAHWATLRSIQPASPQRVFTRPGIQKRLSTLIPTHPLRISILTLLPPRFGIGACFGWETGYAINFARDFGPRLVSYMLGYGMNVWRAGDYYFWIPMVAPFFGCTFGGWLYDMFIYTGESPINTDAAGLARFAKPNRKTWSNTYEEKDAAQV